MKGKFINGRVIFGLFIAVGILSCVVVVLAAMFMCFLLGVKESKLHVYMYSSAKQYQLLSMSPHTGEMSFGYISSHPFRESNLGIMTRTEDNYMVISELGDEEYQCTGTCYCDVDRRYATTKVLQTGLFFLAASISTVLVQKRAQDHFDKECERLFDSSCPSGAIYGELDDCKIVSAEHRGNHPDIDLAKAYLDHQADLKDISEHYEFSQKDFAGFHCEGKCMNYDDPPPLGHKIACEIFDMKDVYIEVPIRCFSEKTGYGHERYGYIAEAKFGNMDLRDFCRNMMTKDPFFDRNVNREEPYCVSLVNGRNPTIRCEPTHVIK